MTDFFKQLVGLAGFGLVGIVIIMVIALAYVVIKKPNNKFAIVVMAAFCLIIVFLFTFAGVGVVKENKQLTEDKKQLSENNVKLNDSVKEVSTKLDIKDLQLKVATEKDLSSKQLQQISSAIASKADTLQKVSNPGTKNDWSKVAVDYRKLSEAVKNDSAANKEKAKNAILMNPKLLTRSTLSLHTNN